LGEGRDHYFDRGGAPRQLDRRLGGRRDLEQQPNGGCKGVEALRYDEFSDLMSVEIEEVRR